MIETILNRTPISKLRITLNQLETKIFGTTIPDDTKFENIKVTFKQHLIPFENSFSFTTNLSKNPGNDKVRDRYLRLFHDTLKLAKGHPDPTVSESAKVLNSALRNYSRESADKGMLDESHDIRNIKIILAKPDNQAHLANVTMLAPYAEALFAAEDDFLAGRIEHDETKAMKILQENAGELRKPVEKYTNEVLLPYVYIMARVEPDVYETLAAELQEIVKENNVAVRGRKKKDEEETPPEERPNEGDNQNENNNTEEEIHNEG